MDKYLNKVFHSFGHYYFVAVKSSKGRYLVLKFTTDRSGHTKDYCYVELEEMKQILHPARHPNFYKNHDQASYIKFTEARPVDSNFLDVFLSSTPEIVPEHLHLLERIEKYLLHHVNAKDFALPEDYTEEFFPKVWAKRHSSNAD